MGESDLDLERLIAAAAELAAPPDPARFGAFARAFVRGLDGTQAGGERALAARIAEAFAFAQRRAPGEIRVRVANPADGLGRSRIQILQDDRLFIVDTVRLVLRRLELSERVLLHPILAVERDASGRLVAVGGDGAPLRESQLYVEVSPRIEETERRNAVEAALLDAMGQVRDVTDDFPRLLAVMRQLSLAVEAAGRVLPDAAERAARVRALLDWLVAGHFVFMGFRRYRLRRLDGEGAGFEVQLEAGSGLGLFRDDATSRLATARRGAEVPDELRDILEDPRILVIGKSRVESPIHRAGRLDRIAVTEYDERGEPRSLAIVFGLFTSQALRTPGSQVPLLSARLQQILEAEGVDRRSHRQRAMFDAFDSAPIEVLLGMDVEGVAALIREIVGSEGSKTARLVCRADRHHRSLYAAVLLPRERYGEDLRARVRHLLEERTGATYIDDRASFIEEGTAVLHYFCTSATGALALPAAAALEAEVQQLCASWSDRFAEALAARFGEGESAALADRYEEVFPEALRVTTHPADAVRDVVALEALSATGEPQFSLYFDHGGARREVTTLRIYLPEPRLLSDLLPVVDAFGIRTVDAQQATVQPVGRPPVSVETLRVLPLGADPSDLDEIAGRLSAAIGAVLSGATESDELNGLVLGAGLDWREVDCIRAYVEYFVQIQSALGRPFLRSVLLENPLAVRLLVRLHQAHFDPALSKSERGAREQWLRRSFEGYRDRIAALNEDRALSGLYSLVEATLRTSFFAPQQGPHRIAFKVDPALVPEITPPRPYREIFVHSAELMGIHLRGGPVARGGLRWSDRLDDLRVEILGLMRTQQLKNGLIVPVGAKGGFALKRSGLSPGEARALADRQYRVFVASLLDLTDNLDAGGRVAPPAGVLRRDGDDPYLVVAADKGTAHLSDAANEVALARDFWLGDAFASGGSEGYDHKKLAITARGAWECARHHFAELGIDPDRESFSAVGIGDMSGDVFGNGLLLMRKVKLLGGFDHRHIFVDPDPDPEVAWAERKRLFELPSSSWADYDPARLSAGGGVFPRAAKQVGLAPRARERLGLGPGRISGYDLVRALLALDVDLLWNGGIGTYVKASHESHLDAGDRANDPVRIDASRLRARVVVEGGNLGLTQAARIEAALAGVRLDTDSVDNSAGVDLSDHEVNYKILLAPQVRSGRISPAERHAALAEASDDACASVLSHNRSQALALSFDELRSRGETTSYLHAIEVLCDEAELDPAALQLPGRKALADRAPRGVGMTRPELAVLLGVAKLVVRRALAQSAYANSEYLEPLLRSYFPPALRDAWPDALREHRLRREIAALVATNRLIDAGGVTLLPALASELSIEIADAAAAALLAQDVLELPARRERLLALSAALPRASRHDVLLELDRAVRAVARFLVRSGRSELDAARARRLRSGLEELRAHQGEFLTASEASQVEAREQALVGQGLPAELASEVAALPLADRGLNVLRACERSEVRPVDAARVYARLGEATGIHWLYERLRELESGGGALGGTAPADAAHWDRMVLVELRCELLDLQRELAEAVLAEKPDDPLAAADAFVASRAVEIGQLRDLEREAGASPAPSALVVVTNRLRALRGS
ncbi:MAG TPA: NAD-glutamate dehydrogenase domain-containing protein [Myxococcota bacterium]|nr:NAD-glutamate dehydrogenase domain-containing protein [Myxococcota bacterium]